jgi:hypothetical protein
MGRLVDTQPTAPGKGDIRYLAPARVLNLAAGDVLPGHLLNKGLDIVTD